MIKNRSVCSLVRLNGGMALAWITINGCFFVGGVTGLVQAAR
jgi:uncharacterized membrane-anchored protein YjiN (DUF445 family)